MTEVEKVRQSILELKDLTGCRCNEAFKSRGLQDPDCHCDYRKDVNTIEEYVDKTFNLIKVVINQYDGLG